MLIREVIQLKNKELRMKTCAESNCIYTQNPMSHDTTGWSMQISEKHNLSTSQYIYTLYNHNVTTRHSFQHRAPIRKKIVPLKFHTVT